MKSATPAGQKINLHKNTRQSPKSRRKSDSANSDNFAKKNIQNYIDKKSRTCSNYASTFHSFRKKNRIIENADEVQQRQKNYSAVIFFGKKFQFR